MHLFSQQNKHNGVKDAPVGLGGSRYNKKIMSMDDCHRTVRPALRRRKGVDVDGKNKTLMHESSLRFCAVQSAAL